MPPPGSVTATDAATEQEQHLAPSDAGIAAQVDVQSPDRAHEAASEPALPGNEQPVRTADKKRVNQPRPSGADKRPSKKVQDSAPIPEPAHSGPSAKAKPSRVKIRLVPFKAVYSLKETARLKAQVFSSNGDSVEKPPAMLWRVKPSGAATVSSGGKLTFRSTGKLTVTGCVGKTSVCNSINRYVSSE